MAASLEDWSSFGRGFGLKMLSSLYDFGMHIGVAFQLKDDLLDVYGDAEVFGKNIGGDILCNKKTYMLIKALEHANADQHDQLNSWINAETFQPAEKIAAVTELYDRIGVKAVCENKMCGILATGQWKACAVVSIAEEKKEELKKMIENLMHREV